jgi:MFS family permease
MKAPRLAWLVLIIAAGSIAVGSGVRSMVGVMIPLIEYDLGYGRADLSVVASVAFFVYAFSQPLSGWAVGHFGPKRALLAGAVLLVLSGLGMIWASSLLAIHLFLGILPMLGFSVGGLLPGTVLAVLWFSHRQGLATGVVVGALPGGQALFAALASVALLALPWREAYVMLTLIFAVVLLLLILFVVRGAPERRAQDTTPNSSAPVSTIRHVTNTRNFWLLVIGYLACGITDQIMLVHIVPFLTDEGYSAAGGGGIFALLSIFGLAGSVIVGSMVDIFESRYVIAGTYLIRALSYFFLFAFTSSGSLWLLVAFAIVFGVTYMGNLPPTSVFVSSAYGSEVLGSTMGWLTLIHHLGGAGGVLFAGIIYERLGGYAASFVGSVIVLLLAVVASVVLPRTRAPRI